MKEVKCEHCGFWTDGSKSHCNYCGGLLNEKRIKEKEELLKADDAGIPFIQIGENDSLFTRIWKSIFRAGQIIFLFIITVIAYIASSVAF